MSRHAPHRFLILDNALNRLLLPEGRMTRQVLGEPADILHAAGGQFPATLTPYCGVILTGSEAAVPQERPWYAPERELVHACLKQDLPLLGICFGAQFLSGALWGQDSVQLLDEPEIGWIRVRHAGDNPLFASLPDDLIMYSGHHWGYQAGVPSLAYSTYWPNQAFQVPGKRAWGIQFHPEIGPAYGAFYNNLERVRNPRIRIWREGQPDNDLRRQIVRNFVRLCLSDRDEA